MSDNEYITLQQALKKYGLVGTGGEAKNAIQNGEVFVDDVLEMRRGRKLYGKEKITYFDQSVIVTHDH